MPHCQTAPSPPSKAHPLPPLSPPRTPHWVATLLIDSFKSVSSTYSLSQVTVRALLFSSVELGLTMKLRSAMELGSAVRWRIGRWGLGWVDELGWWNRSAMRELTGKLERTKNWGRKKKEEKPEREREKENRKCFFNERGERSVIKFFFF